MDKPEPSESSPPITDEKVYLIDAGKLLPGDILLCRDPDGAVSQTIRTMTDSRYSHAAIYVGNGEFVEAIGSGVRRFLVDRTAVRNPLNVRFLRLNDGADARKAAAAAGKNAEAYLARRYWKKGALTAIFKNANRQHGGRFFCSHLVVQAYREAKVELIDGVEPHNVIPDDLMNSLKLQDVTAKVLLPPDAPHRWRPNELLDGPTRRTLHDEEISIQQKVDERVGALFREHGLDAPANFFDAMKVLWKLDDPEVRQRLDLPLAQILKEEGYDALPQLAKEKFERSFEQPRIIRKMIAAGMDATKILEMRSYAQQLQHRLRQRILDDESCLLAFESQWERTGCATFEVMAMIRREVLEIVKDADACLRESIQLLSEALE
jgi:uncharacterized protein YycO